MIKISEFIEARNQYVNPLSFNIPKQIIQTYKNNHIHKKIFENINYLLDLNPDYCYRLITDEIGRSLIIKNFNKDILDAFDKLEIGSAKGDFLRYIAIYLYGGIYLDLDSSISDKIDKFIDHKLDHYLIWDNLSNFINTPLISKPYNPIIFKLINEVAKRINNYEENIFLATGPTVFTDIIYQDITDIFVYNTKSNVSISERNDLWIKNKIYKNGIIQHESYFPFKFYMDNYDESYLYPDNDKYICTFNEPTPFLYKNIHIGSSNENTKIINLNKKYSPETKLIFLHKYPDKFIYSFQDNFLHIKRIDQDNGWGQDLIGYL